MIDVSALHGVEARGRLKDQTGVWVGERKIGQIGIRVSRGCAALAASRRAKRSTALLMSRPSLQQPRRCLCLRRISSHGLAYNVDPDLSFFSRIVPCGIPDKARNAQETELLMPLVAPSSSNGI